jgi:hypothetical protein
MAKVNPDHEELIKQLRGVQYIVINRAYGGFGLSREAVLLYLDLVGITYTLEDQEDRDTQTRLGSKIMVNNKEFFERYDIERNDPALVTTVRRLGKNAAGEFAKLKIVEVPVGVEWYIEEYDGQEWVAEKHRTWR